MFIAKSLSGRLVFNKDPGQASDLAGSLGSQLVGQVHIVEVLDLPGQCPGQRHTSALVLAVAAVAHIHGH